MLISQLSKPCLVPQSVHRYIPFPHFSGNPLSEILCMSHTANLQVKRLHTRPEFLYTVPMQLWHISTEHYLILCLDNYNIVWLYITLQDTSYQSEHTVANVITHLTCMIFSFQNSDSIYNNKTLQGMYKSENGII